MTPRPARTRGRVAAVKAHPWWPAARRLLATGFVVLVVWLLWDHARAIAWGDVRRSLVGLPLSVLAVATLVGASSHLLFSCFDLLGRRYTGHTLAARTVMLVNFISYAFNLNLGSLVGGIAFRFRLYGRLGLRNAVIARVMGFSMLTNWLGYIVLAGVLLLVRPPEFPPSWKLGNDALPWLGAALLVAGAGYLLACWRWPGREWRVRGHVLRLPSWRLAALQAGMSIVNWSLMGTMVWTLLRWQLPWADVTVVLLVGAIAGVITHVPAGLGVLEAVFVALLGDRLAEGELLAGLLAYRGLYYLLPLLTATVALAFVETRARRAKRSPSRLAHAARAPAASVRPHPGRRFKTQNL